MSIAAHALAAAGIAASAAAALALWLAARRQSGRVRLADLWLAGAAAFWCLGVIVQLVMGVPLSGVAVGLTLADLPPLLALVAVLAGAVALVAASGAMTGDGWRSLGQRMARRPVIPRLVDGYVLAAALFVVGWVTLFGPEYIRIRERPIGVRGATAATGRRPPGRRPAAADGL